MVLLLRNPDAHKTLDHKLYEFLQSLRRSQPYAPCATEAREIIKFATPPPPPPPPRADEARKTIESDTGQQPDSYHLIRPTWEDEERATYETSTNHLIRPTWEDDWKGNRRVLTAWFDDSVCGKEMSDALHAVFTEIVRFVLDATTAYRREKYKNQLIERLDDYLDLRRVLPSCYLELLGEGEKALLFGEPVDPPLKGMTYRAVVHLIAVYPSGQRLTGAELDAWTGDNDSRTSLRDLCKKHPHWKQILDFPPSRGSGYALKRLSAPPSGFPVIPGCSPA